MERGVRSERRRASDTYVGLTTLCHSKTELTAHCESAKRVTMSPALGFRGVVTTRRLPSNRMLTFG